MTTCTHHCGCLLAHEPAQALADLLKAAVAVDEIADDIRPIFGSNGVFDTDVRKRFEALRAAVRRLT